MPTSSSRARGLMGEEPVENGGLKSGECPYCGEQVLESRKTLLHGDNIYWQKPWGLALKMDEAVVTMACMECGGVSFKLRDSPRVLREYRELPDDERGRI